MGLSAWQWLFIIEGVITIAIAFGAFFVLPNFPRTTSWLTEEERQLAVWRLEEDIGEDDWIDSAHQTFWQGAKLAFVDIKTYVLMVMLFCIVASGTVTNFFPSVSSLSRPSYRADTSSYRGSYGPADTPGASRLWLRSSTQR